MNEEQVLALLESSRSEADIEAERMKDPWIVGERLRDAYLSLDPQERPLADAILGRWVLSDDEGRRFDAIALIGDLRLASARVCLVQLERRLKSDPAPGAPFEAKKVRRVLDMIGGTPE